MAYGTTHIPDTAAGLAPPARRRFRFGNLSDHFLLIASLGALAFLYAPILVLIIFSFNDNPVTVLPLRGFTLGWYEKAFANADMMGCSIGSRSRPGFPMRVRRLRSMPASTGGRSPAT